MFDLNESEITDATNGTEIEEIYEQEIRTEDPERKMSRLVGLYESYCVRDVAETQTGGTYKTRETRSGRFNWHLHKRKEKRTRRRVRQSQKGER